MGLWELGPFVFAAGFALLYSREVPVITGGCLLMITGVLMTLTPRDPDNFYLGIFICLIGAVVFAIFRPKWLRGTTPTGE